MVKSCCDPTLVEASAFGFAPAQPPSSCAMCSRANRPAQLMIGLS
jgi:hypothetical protein